MTMLQNYTKDSRFGSENFKLSVWITESDNHPGGLQGWEKLIFSPFCIKCFDGLPAFHTQIH